MLVASILQGDTAKMSTFPPRLRSHLVGSSVKGDLSSILISWEKLFQELQSLSLSLFFITNYEIVSQLMNSNGSVSSTKKREQEKQSSYLLYIVELWRYFAEI